MFTGLDPEGSTLLRLLISRLPLAIPDDPSTFISYKEVHRVLGLAQRGATFGRSLQVQGMDSLADWLLRCNLPAITGLIVTEGELQPEKGFFKMYDRNPEGDYQWWADEIARAKSYPWPQLEHTSETTVPTPETGPSKAPATLHIRDIAQNRSKFFLKSEYGPLSDDWPVVAFSPVALISKMQRHYQSSSDFIVYTGTLQDETANDEHRGRLLSLVRIDKTRTYETQKVIPSTSWEWANANYPGKWPYAFKVIEGWSIFPSPRSTDILPISYAGIGKYPYKGNVMELLGAEREALLDLTVVPLTLANVSTADDTISLNALLKERTLNEVALRIANLVFGRVSASGQIFQGKHPIRNAPTDFLLHVAQKLKSVPLVCALCGGIMELQPPNRMLQPSADRIDSDLGEYGPENFQLVHLACNLGKNSSTTAEFEEWLKVVRSATIPGEEHQPA